MREDASLAALLLLLVWREYGSQISVFSRPWFPGHLNWGVTELNLYNVGIAFAERSPETIVVVAARRARVGSCLAVRQTREAGTPLSPQG